MRGFKLPTIPKIPRAVAVTAGVLFWLGVVALAMWYLQGRNFEVLNPHGIVAADQKALLLFASLLSLVIVIPVFVLTFGIVWRYREGARKKAVYRPDWDRSRLLETLWWGVPLILIIVLSVVTWTSTHRLDPFKPIASPNKPLEIQAVALEWKWLFIYPEQGIATVNYLEVPVDTPLVFHLTADAPMNSFWIPELGGQMYAMNAMSTQLNLMATKEGVFEGRSANLSGEGFADMYFTVNATTQTDFDAWVGEVKNGTDHLGIDEYHTLAQPSQANAPSFYASTQPDLYTAIIEQFTVPGAIQNRQDNEGTDLMRGDDAHHH